MSQLNDGFVRPRFDAEVILSYYEASLVCEMIEQQRGSAALVAMLHAYRDGLDTPGVFAKVLGMKPEEVDKQFDAWLRAKFAVPLRAIPPSDGKASGRRRFVNRRCARASRSSGQNQPDSARAALLRAQALFPEYAGAGAPAWYLAQLARDRGDLRDALDQVQRITSRNETAWDANLLEADLRTKLGDSAGARPLERLLWIFPYDIAVHVRLAELATRAGDHALALRERRAVVALDPSDPLDAHYQLARALVSAGDVTAARRELLGVLEQAPSFEKAQALLLELRDKGPKGSNKP